MKLSEKLKEMHEKIKSQIPEISDIFDEDTMRQAESGLADKALKAGDEAPDFCLTDQLGREMCLSEILKDSNVVLSFYRGGWCPYCSLELKALQDALPEILDAGGIVVAVSPQSVKESVNSARSAELTFPVLSDNGLKAASKYGLVYELSENLRPIYQDLEINLPEINAGGTCELPVPATFVISKDGIIRYAFADADYKKRPDTDEILKTLKQL